MDLLTVAIVLLVIATLLHHFIDSLMFLRVGITFIYSGFIKRKVHILEKCTVSGICLTSDLDLPYFNHMNNARFLREIDLARVDFYLRTDFFKIVRSLGGSAFLVTANVRFRKFIGLFQRFKITTRVIYWNDDSIFFEHKFIGRNGFVHTTLLCQQRIIKCSAEAVMEILLKSKTESVILAKPEMPMEVS